MTLDSSIHPFFKGRVALHAILKAAGIGKGDQVLMPGYTCVVVPNAVNYTGAQPIFLDIESRTYNLDCQKLEEGADTQWSSGQAKAIIVQHTYGIPCNMDRITAFAEKHGLLVIEDSCHALGSTWRGRPVGSLGDAAFFSSQWSKPVTTGLGGWAQVNNPELAAKLDLILGEYASPALGEALVLEMQYLAYSLLIRPQLYFVIQGIYRTLGKLGLAIGSSTGAELACKLPSDYQKGMHPLQERRLRKLIIGAQRVVDVRRRNTSLIEEALRNAGLPTLEIPEGCNPALLRYPLLVKNKNELLAEAKRERVPLGDWFVSPIHPNLENWPSAGYLPGSCPVAEQVSEEVVNVSTDHNMSAREISRTVRFLAEKCIPGGRG